jgi:hypothetical protein
VEYISFISSYSYQDPPLETIDNELKMSNKLSKCFKKKISSIFNIALENSHNSLVLSSFGCGGNKFNKISIWMSSKSHG